MGFQVKQMFQKFFLTLFFFSFHEIAMFDLPSQIDLIRSKNGGEKLIFIGHSMGSTVALIYASFKPKEAEKNVQVFINMATPCYFQYLQSNLGNISQHLKPLLEASIINVEICKNSVS